MKDSKDNSPDPDGGGPGERPDGEEPRAGELLSGRASGEELDPETIAQLAAWFGAPAPAGAAPEEPDRPVRSRAEARERRARALAAVDRTFLAALENRWRGESLLCTLGPLSRPRPAPSRFDPDAWDLGFGEELRVMERPEDIRDTLDEPTPQALLRDLHRPDQQWPLRMLPQDLGMDVAGLRARTQIENIVTTPLAVRMDDEPAPARMITEDMAALRARLDEPWEDSYIPPEKRRGPDSFVPTAEDLKWFGMVGFDPDL